MSDAVREFPEDILDAADKVVWREDQSLGGLKMAVCAALLAERRSARALQREEDARIADLHGDGYATKKARATTRTEARDFETMAIASSIIGAAIRSQTTTV